MPTHSKQRTLWLLAALAAPIAHFSGCGWLTAALAALTILPLTCLPQNWEDLSKPMAILQILWLGLVTGTLLRQSASSWPSDNDLVVPLTLLALAVCTNAAAAPRVGAVLALCMALLAIPVAVTGAAKLEPTWLKPTIAPWPMALSLTLLLPALPGSEARKGRSVLYTGLLTVALAALVQGVLSPQVAISVPDPFYQTARTLGPLEPVVAVGLSLGWYAMATYLLQCAGVIAKKGNIGRKTASVLTTGTALGFVLFPQQPNASFVPLISLFMWVLTPLLRKLKDLKNSA